MLKKKIIALLIISSMFVSGCNKNNDSLESFSSEESSSEESSVDISSEVEVIKEQLLSYEKLSVSFNGNNLTNYTETIENDVSTKEGFKDVSFVGEINYKDFDQENIDALKGEIKLNDIDGTFYLDETLTLNDGYLYSYVSNNTVYFDYSCSDLRNVISSYIYQNQTDDTVSFDDIYNELPEKFYISNYTFVELIEELQNNSEDSSSNDSVSKDTIFIILAKLFELNNKYEFLKIEPTLEGTKVSLELDRSIVRDILIDLLLDYMNNPIATRDDVASIVDVFFEQFVKIDISLTIIISYEGDVKSGNISLDIETNNELDGIVTNNYLCGNINFEALYDDVVVNIPMDLPSYLPYELIIDNKETTI